MDAVHARPAAATRLLLSLARLRLRHLIPRLANPRIPFAGTRIIADLSTPLGLHLYRYGWSDSDLALLSALTQPGRVVIDCGANIGLFSVSAAMAGAARVYAFEPAATTRFALERNVAAARTHCVTVLPFALADVTASASFTVMPAGGGLSSFAPASPSAGHTTTVGVRRLDDVIPAADHSQVGVIKIDVEGAEEKLLRGAVKIIATSRPAILIEVEDEHLRRQGSSATRLRDLLKARGYHLAPGAQPPNELYLPTLADTSVCGRMDG